METKIYNMKGKEVGTVPLPENIFGLKWNADLVHQVVVSMMSTARENVAHTKDRGEVRGGGKKPWKQKGTGRARHGSSRSPIWVGGGVAHGPRNDKNYDRKVNRKMKTKAIFTILSKKFKEGEVLFIDSLKLGAPKTKDAKEILMSLGNIKGFEKISTKRKNAAYFGIANKDSATEKSFQNIGSIKVDEFRNVNPVDLMNSKFIVISEPEKAFAFLESKKA
ncbi:MAG: 50S ribosomal protein L4 [bacterium]